MSNMPNPTPQAKSLHQALIARGIKCQLEAYDGYKHVDISIPWAKLDIEVDGNQHYTDAKQMKADLDRSYYSSQNDEFDTIHIPNMAVDKYLDKVADAIARVARDDYYAMKEEDEPNENLLRLLFKKIINKLI